MKDNVFFSKLTAQDNGFRQILKNRKRILKALNPCLKISRIELKILRTKVPFTMFFPCVAHYLNKKQNRVEISENPESGLTQTAGAGVHFSVN